MIKKDVSSHQCLIIIQQNDFRKHFSNGNEKDKDKNEHTNIHRFYNIRN